MLPRPTLEDCIATIKQHRGRTIGEIFSQIGASKHGHFKKGASGLIVENLLGLDNSVSPEADLEEIGVEIKVLPIYLTTGKAKEPTQVKMIDYMALPDETWENAAIRKKIERILWIAYGVRREQGQRVGQDQYVILDSVVHTAGAHELEVFRRDWEEIRNFVAAGHADDLSCSMGEFIEPKTKGANSRDIRDCPDGAGGTAKARRRAFYFKKAYTDSVIIPQLDLSAGDAHISGSS